MNKEDPQYKEMEKMFMSTFHNRNTKPNLIGRIEFYPDNLAEYLEYQEGKLVRRMFHGTSMEK